MHAECGEEASQWLFDMKLLLLSPTLHEIGCDQDTNLGTAAIFGIAVSLAVTFVLILISSVVYRRRAAMKAKTSLNSRGGRLKSTSSSFQNSRKRRDMDTPSMQPLVSRKQRNSNITLITCTVSTAPEDSNAAVEAFQCRNNQISSNGDQTETALLKRNGSTVSQKVTEDLPNGIDRGIISSETSPFSEEEDDVNEGEQTIVLNEGSNNNDSDSGNSNNDAPSHCVVMEQSRTASYSNLPPAIIKEAEHDIYHTNKTDLMSPSQHFMTHGVSNTEKECIRSLVEVDEISDEMFSTELHPHIQEITV